MYAQEAISKAGVPMQHRINKIKAILDGIEKIKAQIRVVEVNNDMPADVKADKLTDMRETLKTTEIVAMALIREEAASIRKEV